nr:hypothetical protein [Tanacetum cinerariifolium]
MSIGEPYDVEELVNMSISFDDWIKLDQHSGYIGNTAGNGKVFVMIIELESRIDDDGVLDFISLDMRCGWLKMYIVG